MGFAGCSGRQAAPHRACHWPCQVDRMLVQLHGIQIHRAIRQELQLADGQWVFFDAALQRMQGGGNVNRQVAEVYVASENLLSSMDRVTGMYAALAA